MTENQQTPKNGSQDNEPRTDQPRTDQPRTDQLQPDRTDIVTRTCATCPAKIGAHDSEQLRDLLVRFRWRWGKLGWQCPECARRGAK